MNSVINKLNKKNLFLENIIIFIMYFAFAKLGFYLALPGTAASIVWFPAGTAVASILLCGYKVLPGIFLGAFLSNFSFFISDVSILKSIQLSFLIATGNSIEALLAKLLIVKFKKPSQANVILKDQLIIFLSILVASSISAIVGSFTHVYLFGDSARFLIVFTTWFLGDAAGIITVILPVLMYHKFESFNNKSFKWNTEKTIYFTLFIFFLILNIILDKNIFPEFALFFYLIIFFIMWAIIRLSLGNVFFSLLLFLSVSIYMTIMGYGPFISDNPQVSLLALQGFVITLMAFSILIRNFLSNQKNQNKIIQDKQDKINEFSEIIKDTQESVIQAMIGILEVHDDYTRGHSENVADLSKQFAGALGLSKKDIYITYLAGIIHDIGKVLIPHDILNKTGKLTDEEYEIMKKHPEYSKRFLSSSNEIKEISKYVFHHHERWDGKGYPEKLKGDEIPLISQIISLADAYDAMTSKRSYRSSMSHEAALEEIKRVSDTQFNGELASKFIKMLE